MLNDGARKAEHKDVWFRDAHGASVHADSILMRVGQPAVIQGLDADVFDGDRWLHYHAETATFVPDEWHLEKGVLVDRFEGESRVEMVDRLDRLQFVPEDVLLADKGEKHPTTLNAREAQELARRSPSSAKWSTLVQAHTAAPWSCVPLLMLGLALMLTASEERLMRGVLLGLLATFGFIAVDLLCRSLGLHGQITPVWAGWFPLLLFGSLGTSWYAGMQR
jgi:lipopolysaccharide export LptBFGC system permease protein LptF